jgi:hypothetical protein
LEHALHFFGISIPLFWNAQIGAKIDHPRFTLAEKLLRLLRYPDRPVLM